eukprot:TRINITY_DN18476_c0_g1_i1.p1 TRINITY_DN18476_c0_g1~~TRINITY_DN18476_c0_g1_i1.p1  ORF type:complete len:214 (-),score=53.50 TRINITY_DN18476_c0_g1_i1:45-686(-)
MLRARSRRSPTACRRLTGWLAAWLLLVLLHVVRVAVPAAAEDTSRDAVSSAWLSRLGFFAEALMEVVTPAGVMVGVVFWTVLVPASWAPGELRTNLVLHLAAPCLTLADVLLHRAPLSPSHAHRLLLLMMLFCLASFVRFFNTGTWHYAFLDIERPWAAGGYTAACYGGLGAYHGTHALAAARDRLAERCLRRSPYEPPGGAGLPRSDDESQT